MDIGRGNPEQGLGLGAQELRPGPWAPQWVHPNWTCAHPTLGIAPETWTPKISGPKLEHFLDPSQKVGSNKVHCSWAFF